MNQARILTEDDRVELINGETIEMSPIARIHATCMRRLINILNFWVN
jgi:Uma2 family endonuclease